MSRLSHQVAEFAPILKRGNGVSLERLCYLKTLSDYYTSSLIQVALEHFLSRGALERRIAKMRRIYARKREVLVEALEPIKAMTQVRGLEVGVNIFLECDTSLDLTRVQNYCEK
ncbi:MAG: hypothetical protein ACRCYY_11740 [Trueperaceae bacterium]